MSILLCVLIAIVALLAGFIVGVFCTLPSAVEAVPLDNPHGDPALNALTDNLRNAVVTERAEVVAAERRRLEQQIIARENPQVYEPLDPTDVIL